MRNYVELLDKAKTLNDVFKVARYSVEEVLGLRRGGIGLILHDLPTYILGYNQATSNYIVLNKRIVEAASRQLNKREFNSLVFTIILHEYLHTLGIYNEETVRKYLSYIVNRLFGEDHPVHRFATYPLIPELIKEASSLNFEKNFEYVRDFGKGDLPYIG